MYSITIQRAEYLSGNMWHLSKRFIDQFAYAPFHTLLSDCIFLEDGDRAMIMAFRKGKDYITLQFNRAFGTVYTVDFMVTVLICELVDMGKFGNVDFRGKNKSFRDLRKMEIFGAREKCVMGHTCPIGNYAANNAGGFPRRLEGTRRRRGEIRCAVFFTLDVFREFLLERQPSLTFSSPLACVEFDPNECADADARCGLGRPALGYFSSSCNGVLALIGHSPGNGFIAFALGSDHIAKYIHSSILALQPGIFGIYHYPMKIICPFVIAGAFPVFMPCTCGHVAGDNVGDSILAAQRLDGGA